MVAIDGPRALRAEELEAVRACTGAVFRPSLVAEYPQLFTADNFENLRVCFDGERCVSHVGMTQRDASLLGCQVKVCCIGAVCTRAEYRGLGLASAGFDDAVAKAYSDSVDFMMVSGNRSLYRRRGCLVVGSDLRFTLTTETSLAVAQSVKLDVTAEPMTEAELPLVAACYRREAVRYLRPLDDYRHALQSGTAMDSLAEWLIVRERGEFRGYLMLRRPHDGKSQLIEYGGDRRALLAALAVVPRRYGLDSVSWQVLRHDDLLRSLCQGAGLPGTPAPASGTFKVINFPQFMARLRPRVEELLGYRDAAALSFWQDGDRCGFGYAGQELVTDRDTATRLVFGTVEGAEAAALGTGLLADVLKRVLPVPTLWYGLNYV